MLKHFFLILELFIILCANLVLFNPDIRLCFAFPDLAVRKLLTFLPFCLPKLITIYFAILASHLNNKQPSPSVSGDIFAKIRINHLKICRKKKKKISLIDLISIISMRVHTIITVAYISFFSLPYYNLTNMYEILTKKTLTDRFIPQRTNNTHSQMSSSKPILLQEPSETYQRLISREMITPLEPASKNTLLQGENYSMSTVKHLLTSISEQAERKPAKRNIHLSPEKVLDAPDILDDYYLNLLDWSSKGTLSIGLDSRVYLYTPASIRQLAQKQDEYICSVSSNPQGELLAVGLSKGGVEIYDIEREMLILTLRGHIDRVSSSAFTFGMLFTGSKDTKIISHDLRSHQSTISKYVGHRGQVCGLKHDACGLASGSNDNQAIIWDLNAGKARLSLQGHKAAVKALAWCPWQRNLLATGGGTADKTMRFWNIETGKLINTVNTESQVCSLIWNKNDKEILSSHGFSQNQLSLWRYPSCSKVADLKGHSKRVLHMAMAPDNSSICTASADETLRFWKAFEGKKEQKGYDKCKSVLNIKSCSLR